jgi:hypothetical protein
MTVRTNTKPTCLTYSSRLMLVVLSAAAFNTSLCFAGELPSRNEIIAKMIEAEGGAAAKRKVKNRVLKLDLDLGVGGMKGKGVVHFARPGKVHSAMEITGMGTMEEGVVDGVAWANAMMTGPQIKEGAERAFAIRESNLDGLLDWKSYYKNIECVGKETIDGKECFKVEFTPKEGSVMTSYIDAKTYLPYRNDLKLTTAMGDFDMVAYTEDYRSVDGLMYSFKSRIEVMGQKRVVILESIEHNVEMPKDIFKLPDEIKALVAKNKANKGKP